MRKEKAMRRTDRALATPTAPLRALIVEGHEGCRGAVRDLLARLGCQVEEAADGEEGLSRALERPPDLAVVGMSLPGIDGCAVACGVRTVLGHYTLLLALSRDGHPEDRRRAEEAGFDAFLPRPVAPAELSGWLHQAASGAAWGAAC
jgi:CheY-like chemotaxis protein